MAYHNEYLELISAALDGALSPDDQARLDAHLDACPDCKALYDQLWVTAKAVKGLPEVEPPADLTNRIMAAVAADNVIPFAPKKARQPWKKWAATAAVLAVIVAGGYTATRIMGSARSTATNSTPMMATAMQEVDEAGYSAGISGYGDEDGPMADTVTAEAEVDDGAMLYNSFVGSGLPEDNGDILNTKQMIPGVVPAEMEPIAETAGADDTLAPEPRMFTMAPAENSEALPDETPGEMMVTAAYLPGESERTDLREAVAMESIAIDINGQIFEAVLNDSPAAQALREALPLTLDMTELNGNEKYHYLDFSLPAEAQNVGTIHTGDLMLFGDSCLVLFYEDFSTSYTYTPLGALTDPAGLAETLGTGNVTVTFSAR